MSTEPPTIGEVSRRVDDLRSEVRDGNRGIHERLDKMPTNELLLAYLAKTDSEVAGLKEDVTEMRSDLVGFKKSIADARRWGIGAVISCGGLLIAGIGLVRSFVS